MTATPREPQAVPQADDDERDDGPNPVGVMGILSVAFVLVYVGVMLGLMTRIDQWAWALGAIR
jgi:hypothetical protein